MKRKKKKAENTKERKKDGKNTTRYKYWKTEISKEKK